MVRRCLGLLSVLSMFAAGQAAAEQCPPVLASANRLVLVTAPGMNRERVTMRTYQRASVASAWQTVGGGRSMVIGRAGMGWGYTFRRVAKRGEPLKREGDKRTPAGIFAVGKSFGFKPSSRPGHLVLRRGETVCVDDVRSPAYNTIQKRSVIGAKVSAENMGAIKLYRHGLFVDYPSNARARAGSCIFIHLLPKSGRGTLGCLALPEKDLLALQKFTVPGAALAVLPEHALSRFADCLPAL